MDQTISLLPGRNRVLEMVATGAPLAETLEALIAFIEGQEPGMRCGLLAPTEDRARLRRGWGRSLPASYHDALDGVRIEPPYRGACIEAIATGKPLVVPDVAADTCFTPLWRDLLIGCGVRAVRSTPIIGPDGCVLGSFAMYFDHPRDPSPAHPDLVETAGHLAAIVLQREREERRVHAGERQLQSVVEALAAAVCVVDREGRVNYCNEAAVRLAGRRPEPRAGQWCVVGRAVWPDGCPVTADDHPVAVAVREGRPLSGVEVIAEQAGGARIPIMAFATPLRDEAGAVTGAVNMMVDIGDRLRAERALRESEERQRTLLAASPFATVVLDPAGKVLLWNKAAESLFGWTAEQVLGRLVPLHSRQMRAEYADIMARILRGERVRVETRRRHRDGREVEVCASAAPMRNADGAVTEILAQFEDITDRKRAEAEAAAYQARLQAVIDTVPAAVWFTRDPAAAFITGNAEAARMLRTAPTANFSLTAPPDQRALAFRAFHDGVEIAPEHLPMQRAVRGADVPVQEQEIRFADGSSMTMLVSAKPLRDRGGAITGAVCAAVDITERRETEAALRASEEEFRALAENMPILCWMARADGWIYWYSRRWHEYAGTTPSSMEGWGWKSLHDPAMLPEVTARWQESLATGRPFDMTFPLRGADGVFRPFLTRAVPVRGPDGVIARWFGTNTDVSEQQRVQAVLRDQGARLKIALDTGQLGSWELLLPSLDLIFSELCKAHFGLRPDEDLSYARAFDVIHPDDRARVEEAVQGAVEKRQDYDTEFRTVWPDGSVRWIVSRGRPFYAEDGTPQRMIGVTLDQTDRKRDEETLRDWTALLERTVEARTTALEAEIADRQKAEAALQQARKMEALGQLAGGIAHDFNNVLQAVSGGLSLIQKRAGDADLVRQLARMAGDAAARGAAVTARLLAFARKGELRAEAIGARSLLESLREMLVPTLGATITVDIDAEPDLPPLLADKAQLETVLLNLAVNARDAMPAGGALRISVLPETVTEGRGHPAGLNAGAYMRLAVRDTGIGMDAATLARATEPFFTTKPTGQGTGLGLAMARGFATQSGGGFRLRSTVGEGTTVELWFPQAAPAEAGESAPAKTYDARAGAAHVLVVDDDAMVRDVLAGQLAEMGYRTSQAPDGLAALERLDSGEAIDLLVTDYSMPGMNGLLLLDEARRRRPALPALLLTGYVDSNIRVDVEEGREGMTALLRKPVASDELASHAAALLKVRTRPAAQEAIGARPF